MKNSTIILTLILLGLIKVDAQSILRYTPATGEGVVYTILDSAYAQAQDDDILYLSGHTFQFTPNAVEKRLQWIGAGFSPDSTSATGFTKIIPSNSGNISFIIRPTAGGSSFSGINFSGLRLNDVDVAGSVSLVTFSRCLFSSDWISLSYTVNWTGSQLNYRFQECVFNTFVNGNGFQSNAPSNITFDNCLFAKGLFRLRTGTYNFNHCVFWATSPGDRIQQNEGCNFANCIFWYAAEISFIDAGYMASGNYFDHCVFTSDVVQVYGSGANPTVVSSCIAGVTDLFVETNGNFNYEDGDDYHLVASSPALTAGSDDGECGIYGGASPAKPGWIPFNPHVSSKVIAPSTVNGTLNITFTTSAQNH